MGRNELGRYFFIAAFDIITFKSTKFHYDFTMKYRNE